MEKSNIKTKPNLWKRIFAGIIDYTVIFSVVFLMIEYFGVPSADGGYHLEGFPALMVVVIWFMYIVFCEVNYGGTFGNLFFDLKVVSIKGNNTKLTYGQSLKRHLLDTFEIWPASGFITFLLIKNTQYNQRIGDLWAKTIVIDTKDTDQYYKRFE